MQLLKKQYPEAQCSLDYETVHQLLVATILSAQCTDERVNIVTPALFKKYRNVEAFAAAKPAELAVRAIQYSSKPGENVLDLFGGSGSALIGFLSARYSSKFVKSSRSGFSSE